MSLIQRQQAFHTPILQLPSGESREGMAWRDRVRRAYQLVGSDPLATLHDQLVTLGTTGRVSGVGWIWNRF